MSHRPLPMICTIQIAAEWLGTPFNTVRAHVYAGTLKSVKIGRRGRRIRRADLLAHVGLTVEDYARDEAAFAMASGMGKSPVASDAAAAFRKAG